MIPTPEGAKTKAAPRAKRFYKAAGIESKPEGFQVLLDGKLLKTAARGPLLLPTEALASAIAAEWNAQGDEIIPETMKQMQFACATLDYTESYRTDVEEETLGYAETDLLCYHASEPASLAERQQQEWLPQLAWVEAHFGVKPHLAGGIMPVPQNAELMAALRAEIEKLPVFALTALWLITKSTASLLLAMAVLHGHLTAAEAFRLSRLEETVQNEQWGEDDEARERREFASAEMNELARFLAAVSA